MHPVAADCFITRMLTLILSILAYCSNSILEYLQKCTKEAAIGGSNAQVTSAIKALIFLLPMTGKKRLTAKESFDLLITYVEPGSSINLTEKLAHPKLYIKQSADDNNQLNGLLFVMAKSVWQDLIWLSAFTICLKCFGCFL
ncbi:uncharacterized protein LOC136078945 [Hydra vulgaris]|uniref:Uncharacterized protein LOC136078945 n=1 Tax=Hydra vulgaris TaxID=6087 RepID=A0ABM4BNX0_HYDVU